MIIVFNPNLHSVADLITNSSSELFVCNTDKTEEQIKSMLQQFVGDGKGHGVGQVKTFKGVEGLKTVVDLIGIYYLDRGKFDDIINCFVPENVKLEIPKFNDNYYVRLHSSSWKDVVQESKDANERLFKWIDDNTEILSKYVKSIVILEGEDDNSVTYEVTKRIYSEFKAVRFFLG